jgi:hypothetical protein
MKPILAAPLLLFAFAVRPICAGPLIDTIAPWGWFTEGQIVNSTYLDEKDTTISPVERAYAASYQYYDFNRVWYSDFWAGVKFVKLIGESQRLCFHPALSVKYNTVLKKGGSQEKVTDFGKNFGVAILELSYGLKTNATERTAVGLRAGYFTLKYNPDATNLGEYLFRSTAYPQFLVSGFEVADKVKLLGAQFTLELFKGKLTQDFFLTQEHDVYPIYDFTLSYLARLSPLRFIDVQAGVSWAHAISVDEGRTTPGSVPGAFDAPGEDFYVRHVDGEDTINYSFRGVKAMARLALDIKSLFPTDIFGPRDLRLYAEAAVLGIQDYPGFYDSLYQRIPVMIGFTVPTFKVLDVLAVEVELFSNRYPNSLEYVWERRAPAPYDGVRYGDIHSQDSTLYPYTDKDNLKWSVYLKKTFGKSLALSGQIANDHLQRYSLMPGYFRVYQDVCQKPSDWYWMLRVHYLF